MMISAILFVVGFSSALAYYDCPPEIAAAREKIVSNFCRAGAKPNGVSDYIKCHEKDGYAIMDARKVCFPIDPAFKDIKTVAETYAIICPDPKPILQSTLDVVCCLINYQVINNKGKTIDDKLAESTKCSP